MSSVPVAIESVEENTMLTDLVANSLSSNGNTTGIHIVNEIDNNYKILIFYF